MEYAIQDKKLIWDADMVKNNNLFIKDIWNMKDTVGYDDACVAVRILSDDSFYFITYCGLGFTVKLVGDTVECIQQEITK